MINLPGEFLTIGGVFLILIGIYKTISDARHGRAEWTAEDGADIVTDVALVILGIVVFWVGFHFFT